MWVKSLNEHNTHTHTASGLQLGHGDCQLSTLGIWQGAQLPMPGMSREGGRGGQTENDGRGKIKKAKWQIGRRHMRIKEEGANSSSVEHESQFTCKTGCQMLIWFSTCVAICIHWLGGVRQMKQLALLYTNISWQIDLFHWGKYTKAHINSFGQGPVGGKTGRKYDKRNMEGIERGSGSFKAEVDKSLDCLAR